MLGGNTPKVDTMSRLEGGTLVSSFLAQPRSIAYAKKQQGDKPLKSQLMSRFPALQSTSELAVLKIWNFKNAAFDACEGGLGRSFKG
jgi:hypothetical protein